MKFLLLFVAIAVLAGCSNRLSEQELSLKDNDQCLSYGVKKGSDAYVACRLQQEQLRQAQAEAKQQAWSAWGDRMQRAGENYSEPGRFHSLQLRLALERIALAHVPPMGTRSTRVAGKELPNPGHVKILGHETMRPSHVSSVNE